MWYDIHKAHGDGKSYHAPLNMRRHTLFVRPAWADANGCMGQPGRPAAHMQGYCLTCNSPSVRGSHHRKHMGSIFGKCLPVPFQVVSQLKKEFLAFVFALEKRLKHDIPLGEVVCQLPGVTVCGRSRDTVCLINIICHGLVQCHVLRGEIIIVVVIGVKVFQFFLVYGNLYGTLGSFAPEVAAA